MSITTKRKKGIYVKSLSLVKKSIETLILFLTQAKTGPNYKVKKVSSVSNRNVIWRRILTQNWTTFNCDDILWCRRHIIILIKMLIKIDDYEQWLFIIMMMISYSKKIFLEILFFIFFSFRIILRFFRFLSYSFSIHYSYNVSFLFIFLFSFHIFIYIIINMFLECHFFITWFVHIFPYT